MKEEIFDRYIQAGAAAKKILSRGADQIKPDITLIEVATFVEDMIQNEGFGVAFPVNISLNEAAAHDTPSPDDTRTFAPGDMVKLDIGVHLDGYIADKPAQLISGISHSSVKHPLQHVMQQLPQ